MSDATVSFGLDRPEEETRLTRAIDAFTRWRADVASEEVVDRDTPGLIVKTDWGPDGALRKTLIFEERKWADFFLKIWGEEEIA